MTEDIDMAASRLCATGWAAKPRDRFGDMDVEQRAMLAKLLSPPAPVVTPRSCSWAWTSNSLGRQWRITGGKFLMYRGFTEDSLNAQFRRLEDDGYIIERGVDTMAVAA